MKNDIFKKACLIQLTSSVWQCSRVLNQKVMAEKIGQDNKFLVGRKYLIEPTLLGPVKTAVQQARKTVQRHSLPFPITSIYLVPKEALTEIDERLQYFKERFWQKVQDFEALYGSAKEEAAAVLGNDLFNEADYPTDILSKFKLDWRYFELSTPAKSRILSPEIYEREKEKFASLMEETREMAMIALRNEFSNVVNNLVERLTNNDGKPKMVSNAMFNKLNEFLNDFSTRNIFEDEELVGIIEQAKSVVSGVSPYGLKYNDVLQKKITKGMSEVNEAINASIEEIPRRHIKLAANE
ncbi:DUF3150 domain-containing protein [Desulfobacter latus]|uniref:DUF3150 domain-containing protein n=1 Tax=Desulfobacter latus TaxID=2292 RepID=A0A850TCC8_9BACT|nr:DUF3150 domain-containing protein [Desulfobacter latus]NWH05897.1 hypothetical protein [Desulfobacter latus]